MKKQTILILLLFVTTITLAQKKEKIKGSKIVTIEQKEIGNFDAIEVNDNLEVYLDRGEKCEVKIEADDNLHSSIYFDIIGSTLKISTYKMAYRYKKLIVRVTYTKDLKMITANENSIINAIQEIQVNEFTAKSFGSSVLNLNVSSKDFNLQSDDKSKTELNLKSENVYFQLSERATLKSLVSAVSLKCDLYGKSEAILEGELTNSSIRLDNNSELTAKNLVAKNIDLLTESYSKCSVNASTNITIDAIANSNITLYGDPKIEIKRFSDNVILSKKPSK